MRVAIIGCGLIGQKRARALAGAKLTVCCDVKPGLAEKLAAAFPGARATASWQEAVTAGDVDIVVVSTVHKELAPVAAAAAAAGKHVLLEKPGARRAAELDAVLEASAATGARVRVGFNHRYHPALQKARELVDSGVAHVQMACELLHVVYLACVEQFFDLVSKSQVLPDLGLIFDRLFF